MRRAALSNGVDWAAPGTSRLDRCGVLHQSRRPANSKKDKDKAAARGEFKPAKKVYRVDFSVRIAQSPAGIAPFPSPDKRHLSPGRRASPRPAIIFLFPGKKSTKSRGIISNGNAGNDNRANLGGHESRRQATAGYRSRAAALHRALLQFPFCATTCVATMLSGRPCAKTLSPPPNGFAAQTVNCRIFSGRRPGRSSQ